jgi:hypothetical protein
MLWSQNKWHYWQEILKDKVYLDPLEKLWKILHYFTTVTVKDELVTCDP